MTGLSNGVRFATMMRANLPALTVFFGKYALVDRSAGERMTITEERPMKAMLYMPNKQEPVAVFDEVQIVKMNDNHAAFPYRITYYANKLNAGKTMVELHRDVKMVLKLEDGRACNVLLQHSSMDAKGRAVGVLRVLDGLDEPALAQSTSPESGLAR
ncbi:MAG TPA: hypothetical protein VNK95_19480 [Caldilineaceae bacterium]|nr:hypothetical protein [Caldilineaceae bacterium]